MNQPETWGRSKSSWYDESLHRLQYRSNLPDFLVLILIAALFQLDHPKCRLNSVRPRQPVMGERLRAEILKAVHTPCGNMRRVLREARALGGRWNLDNRATASPQHPPKFIHGVDAIRKVLEYVSREYFIHG